MWISRFRIENFSSFSDSGWIALDQKFNLFVGRNNSGKSALLRSIIHPLPDNPHKTPECFRGSNLKRPEVSIDVEATFSEIFNRFEQVGAEIFFPVEDNSSVKIAELVRRLGNLEDKVIIKCKRDPGQDSVLRGSSSLEGFKTSGYSVKLVRQDGVVKSQSVRAATDNLAQIVSEAFSSIFHFNAERLNIGKSALNSPERLTSDAQNLPAVLAHLQGARRPVFDKIEKHVIDVIGGIERITVKPVAGSFQILTWPLRDSNYEELSFGLNDSGTGISQVLAILTAVVTNDQSVIIIDEINSFIHPSAVKKLLHLLRSQYGHHQYIISTHSSDTISACSPENMYIVDRNGFNSSVRGINLDDAEQAREVAGHLGFSMMDVFGFDRVIWVEGPTEEVCFQYIIREFGIERGAGMGFAAVGSPAELTNKSAKKKAIVEIYERAGKRLSPLLKGMAFALDREKLSDEEVAIQERGRRKLRLLPRRCFECYLLEPFAIAAVLSDLDGQDIDPALVEATLLKLSGEEEFGAKSKWKGSYNDEIWLRSVDGAKLIGEIFLLVTENRVEYRKTRDGIEILKHISLNRRSHINQLIDFVRKLVEIALKDTKP